MGSRYRCRVAPSGVPGCEPGEGNGPNLLEVIEDLRLEPINVIAGTSEELNSIPVILGEDEAVIVHYKARFTNAGVVSGDLQLTLSRDATVIDDAPSRVLASVTAGAVGFALDDPGPGSYDYRVEAIASDSDFIVTRSRLLVEVVRRSIVTVVP